MNVVDSSGWLEYLADGPNAEHFARPIQSTATLVVPSVSLFEVFKRVSTQRGVTFHRNSVSATRTRSSW